LPRSIVFFDQFGVFVRSAGLDRGDLRVVGHPLFKMRGAHAGGRSWCAFTISRSGEVRPSTRPSSDSLQTTMIAQTIGPQLSIMCSSSLRHR